jgi:CRP-like cAMP-binding protein
MKVLRARTRTLKDLLPPPLMARLLGEGQLRRYADGQIVQERGDDRAALSIVTRGEVVAGNLSLDGALLASALLRPGETFGEFSLFAGLPRTQTLWAQGDVEIAHVSAARFWPLFDTEPALARALMSLTVARNYEILEFVDAQRRLKLPARLVQLLLMAVEEGAPSAQIACRQEDLAMMLGLSRVAIGKALTQLAAQGLVVPGYGEITLPDVPRLRRWFAAQDQRQPLDAV